MLSSYLIMNSILLSSKVLVMIVELKELKLVFSWPLWFFLHSRNKPTKTDFQQTVLPQETCQYLSCWPNFGNMSISTLLTKLWEYINLYSVDHTLRSFQTPLYWQNFEIMPVSTLLTKNFGNMTTSTLLTSFQDNINHYPVGSVTIFFLKGHSASEW